jgi:hypothetical protein
LNERLSKRLEEEVVRRRMTVEAVEERETAWRR